MSLEAIILSCGILTSAQASHIRKHWLEYDNRAVACAIIRGKQEQPKSPLKNLEDARKEREAKEPQS